MTCWLSQNVKEEICSIQLKITPHSTSSPSILFFSHQTVTVFVRDVVFCIAVHVVRIPCVSGQSWNGSNELPAVELHPSCFSNFRSRQVRANGSVEVTAS